MYERDKKNQSESIEKRDNFKEQIQKIESVKNILKKE